MPVVGEAWYELSARDEKLVSALKHAEGQARSTGNAVEHAIDNNGATKGMDKAAGGVGRFGGMLDRVKGKAGGLGGAISGLASGVLMGVGMGAFMGVTAAAGALVDGIGSAIQAASDLNETVSKIGVVFGPASDRVLKFGETAALSLGMSKNSALAAAGTFGNLMTAMGLTSDKSADMSIGMVKLAGDLASFNNVSPEEALEALRSGLVGEAEPLRRFGVQLSEARIQQEALAMGLISSTRDAITPAAKAQAIYSLVMKDTSKAQGDFARTSSGLANQQRIASAKMEDGMARVGQAILPLANTIVPALSAGIGVLMDWIASVIEGIAKWVGENKLLFDILGSIAGFIGSVFIASLQTAGNVLGAVFKVIGDVISGVASFVKPILQGIIGAIRQVMEVAAEIPGPWQDAAKTIRDELRNMEEDAKHWGEATTDTAADTGAAIPPAVADPMAAGAGIVTDGAEDMVSGIPDAVGDARRGAAAEAKKTPREIADSIRDGKFVVKDAVAGLKDAMATELRKPKEIAKIEGFLASKALKKALNDGRPGVRAEAEAWKKAAEERLFALRNGVAEYALKTGKNYADALADKKAAVATATAFGLVDPTRRSLHEFRDDAERYGRNTGKAYGDGLSAMAGYIRSHAADALAGAKTLLNASSPPKDPQNPLHQIDLWGARTAQAYAEAFSSQGGYLGSQIQSFLNAAAPAAFQTWTPELRASLTPGALPGMGQTVTVRHEIVDTDGTLGKAGMTPGQVADALVKGLDATGLFYGLSHVASMRGSA